VQAQALFVALVAAAVALGSGAAARGQGQISSDDGVKYSRGQNVAPVFEGWIANPDGTFSLVFGYFNRNWEEELFIPIGPDNRIEPGGPDRGQPTFFEPRRGKNLFEVVVPKDFGKKEVVWTLTRRGKTERAFGSLNPEEVISRHMIAAGTILTEAAQAGNDDVGDERESNQPPSVTLGAVAPVRLPGSATLTAAVRDDGFQELGGRGRGSRGGLRVQWSLYRGPGKVAFEPVTSSIPSLTNGNATTTVKFAAAGVYWLRATATDVGRLSSTTNVTVTVNPN
jgi:hypothetical protein